VAEPGKLNWGTLGERTTTDAFRQWLGEHWNTKFVAIPFKGGSEITAALLGNTIDGAKIGLGNSAPVPGGIAARARPARRRAARPISPA
jgi:tripartite-type tricarboxylate transporter receptor subunit TctC